MSEKIVFSVHKEKNLIFVHLFYLKVTILLYEIYLHNKFQGSLNLTFLEKIQRDIILSISFKDLAIPSFHDPFFLSIYRSVRLSIIPSIYLSVCLSLALCACMIYLRCVLSCNK